MNEHYARCGEPFCLGRTGEHLARAIVFDLKSWKALYGEGKAELMVRRSGETVMYPVPLEIKGDTAVWGVTQRDVAIPGAGGECELRYTTADGTLAKSEVWSTSVKPSMKYAQSQPPEETKPWLDTLNEHIQTVLKQRESARQAAAQAAESAGNAARSAQEARDAVSKAGIVRSVNGNTPDENGDVEIDSVASWNELTDKPFGEAADGTITALPARFLPESVPCCVDGGRVEILPECQPEFVEDQSAFFLMDALDLTVGETYIVRWNGTDYNSVALDSAVIGEPGYMVLGDVYTATGGEVGSAPTGEPFIMMVLPAEAVAEMGFGVMIMPIDGTSELMVSICADSVEIRKLDNRCLDLEWLPTVGLDTLIEKTEIAPGDFMTALTYHVFPTGTELVVVMDGAPYKVTVKQNGSGLDASWYLGNGLMASPAYEGTNDPFCVQMYSTGSLWRFADGGTHTIEICEEVPNKMPPEFLPDDAAQLYLVSPNGTKFAITVADDGTLSAAAVTAG